MHAHKIRGTCRMKAQHPRGAVPSRRIFRDPPDVDEIRRKKYYVSRREANASKMRRGIPEYKWIDEFSRLFLPPAARVVQFLLFLGIPGIPFLGVLAKYSYGDPAIDLASRCRSSFVFRLSLDRCQRKNPQFEWPVSHRIMEMLR